ncbi:hypothetical protein ABFX02_11G069900 [Erythranthe guttata]
MEHVLHPLLLFFIMYCMVTISYAQDFLQNPDFEIPPSNITANSTTSQFILLTKANSIPGWSFNGTVSYVTSGANLSFAWNGGAHAVQLGENGTIKQTLIAKGEVLDYMLSFNLIPQSEDCANNRTAVNVSINGKSTYYDKSKVFSLERNLTTNLWESHALYLGRLGDESIDITIASVKTNHSQNNNVTCWPLVDAFTVKKNWLPRWYDGNGIANEGFEIGPGFLKNSSEGIILDEEQDRFNSPLQEWSILGKIKYIDSKNYKVPRGKAAIELLSGNPSGVRMDLILETTYTYTLTFTMGDANDSCAGDLTVHVQLGNYNVHNFTMRSNGTGSALKRSITFKSEERTKTPIALYSFNATRTSSGVLCGPVIDNVILQVSGRGKSGSYRERMKFYDGVLILSFFTTMVMLMMV